VVKTIYKQFSAGYGHHYDNKPFISASLTSEKTMIDVSNFIILLQSLKQLWMHAVD
jgi:hypothetical protein